MDGDENGTRSFDRRHVLGLLGGGAAGLAGFAGHTAAESVADDGGTTVDDGETTYRLVQGERCLELTPLAGDESASAFYDWDTAETSYSSAGTTDLQRPDTSVLFLYEAPDGTVSLVVVHGKLDGDHDGGSATFDFYDLPKSGEWTIRDDYYDAATNYDNWATDSDPQTVDWTWASGRTDGGIYGPLGEDVSMRIEPSFNEAAALFEEYNDGQVTEWQALSGDRDDPERFTLDMSRSVRLEVGPCEASEDDSDGGEDGSHDEERDEQEETEDHDDDRDEDDHEEDEADGERDDTEEADDEEEAACDEESGASEREREEAENEPPGHGGTPPGHGGEPPGHGESPGNSEHSNRGGSQSGGGPPW